MSLKAIREIQNVEETMDQQRSEARAKAQRLIAEAEREGRELLKRGREDSAKKTAEVIKASEERAEARRAEILSAAEKDCAALKAGAEAKLAQAVQMILGRVVES